MRALVDLALENSGPRGLSETLFIFPHSRPALYLENIIRLSPSLPKPCILPRSLSVHDLFAGLCLGMENHGTMEAGLLDRVALLLACARKLRDGQKNAEPRPQGYHGLEKLPLDDAGAFFPWGLRLADLFEDCLYQAKTPADITYTEDYVEPFAAALLANLGGLHAEYVRMLEENSLTTPGLNAMKAAGVISGKSVGFLSGHKLLRGKNIIIAGFHSLSGAEDLLFHALWAGFGAKICLHGDQALLEGKGHWSCAPLFHWIRDWKTEAATFGKGRESGTKKPALHYYAGYDLHRQLAAASTLLEDLAEKNKNAPDAGMLGETVVILPDTSLLAPTLHHLPEEDFNVSMGYPLGRSTLFRLLEDIMNLQENRQDSGYYWRDRINLIRHPYIKMLRPGIEAQTGIPGKTRDADEQDNTNKERAGFARKALRLLEREWRNGKRFLGMENLLEDLERGRFLSEPASPENAALLKKIILRCFSAWEECSTLAQCADAMTGLYNLLVEHGGDMWERFRIDAECLRRMTASIIPELRACRLRDEVMPRAALFEALRQMLNAERVPFEGYPLTALQVMGLLESRLLLFKNVLVINATDNLLPGSPPHDPLLPDNLRRQIGLPDALRKQRLSAYHFFRLLAGAENVHLFWQEGVESGGLQENKKLKSRFIEELLWAEEQKSELRRMLNPQAGQGDQTRRGNISGDRDGPLITLDCPTLPVNTTVKHLKKSPLIREKLAGLLRKPLSPSFLDAYLSCPLRFYYEKALRLTPPDEVNEGDDPLSVGILLHEVLKEFYSTRAGRVLRYCGSELEQAERELTSLFLRRLEENTELQKLPADSMVMLTTAGPERLKYFLRNQPETEVLLLEESFDADLSLPAWLTEQDGAGFSGPVRLLGVMDRVDRRRLGDGSEYITILDYKTGRLHEVKSKLWEDEALWERIHLALESPADQGELDEIFRLLRENMGSLQLPAYIYLARKGKTRGNSSMANALVKNAALVELAAKGQEKNLLPPELLEGRLVADADAEEPGVDENDALLERILEERIPALLAFIVVHLLTANEFSGIPDRRCASCPCSGLCRTQREG